MSRNKARRAGPQDSGQQMARWKRRLAAAMGAACVVAACLAIRMVGGPHSASAGTPSSNADTGAPQKPQIMAMVNNEEITRQELAQECLAHYGKEVLEAMVNKYLIAQYTQRLGITVTQQEVDAEVDKMARKFSLTPDQWYKMLKQERDIEPEQYANDIVWPTLALRKLAATQIEPQPQEIDEAFDARYGESIKARLIVVNNLPIAQEVAEKAGAQPDDFQMLARKYSVDSNSASAGGLIQPIHHHVGEKAIEDAAFALAPGQVSPIVPVNNQFVILRCEERLPPARVDINAVKEHLAEGVREKKLHKAAEDIFHQLQASAVIQNVYNDPQKSQQYPGVAAIVNDRKITITELSEACIQRHGKDALEGTINRHLLAQSLRTKHLEITQADIDAEIGRAAIAMGKVTKDHKPDFRAWIDLVTKEQGISYEMYVRDAVWPTAALKKIVGDVHVTDEDLTKGFEANYGPRVRCRAIVLTNQRKAQEVWQLARKELDKPQPDPEYFGRLAEQYSVDPSKSMQGRVPPIQKWGGTPMLEEQAFRLKAGEISDIIQVGEQFVILYCEGHTEPQKVTLADVRDLLYDDIHEKKFRLAMAQEFSRMKDAAQIDNYLTGSSQSPKTVAQRPAGALPGSGGMPQNVVPASGQSPVEPPTGPVALPYGK